MSVCFCFLCSQQRKVENLSSGHQPSRPRPTTGPGLSFQHTCSTHLLAVWNQRSSAVSPVEFFLLTHITVSIPLEGSLKIHFLISTLTFNYSHLQIFTPPPRSFPQIRQEACCSASVHHQAVRGALLFTDPLRSPHVLQPLRLITLNLGVTWLACFGTMKISGLGEYRRCRVKGDV